VNEVMKEPVVQGGCSGPMHAAWQVRDYLVAFSSGVVFALSASLLSLVALTLSRPMIGGERAERFAWSWGHAQVIVALFAVLTMAVFKYYRATETWLTANSFLVSNTIVAAAVPFLLADMVLEAVIPW